MIYNSPYYGYETRADLFFDLQSRFAHLVGFKEFAPLQAQLGGEEAFLRAVFSQLDLFRPQSAARAV